MSYWINVESQNDVSLSDDGKTIDVWVKEDDTWGNIYAQIPIEFIRAVLPAPGWRDVREELPENTETVLVYVAGSIYLGWFFEDRWCGSHIIGAVTHWMPLPAPPSGKE